MFKLYDYYDLKWRQKYILVVGSWTVLFIYYPWVFHSYNDWYKVQHISTFMVFQGSGKLLGTQWPTQQSFGSLTAEFKLCLFIYPINRWDVSHVNKGVNGDEINRKRVSEVDSMKLTGPPKFIQSFQFNKNGLFPLFI